MAKPDTALEIGCDGCPYIGPRDGEWYTGGGPENYCAVCAHKRQGMGLMRRKWDEQGHSYVIMETVQFSEPAPGRTWMPDKCPVCVLVGFDCGHAR